MKTKKRFEYKVFEITDAKDLRKISKKYQLHYTAALAKDIIEKNEVVYAIFKSKNKLECIVCPESAKSLDKVSYSFYSDLYRKIYPFLKELGINLIEFNYRYLNFTYGELLKIIEDTNDIKVLEYICRFQKLDFSLIDKIIEKIKRDNIELTSTFLISLFQNHILDEEQINWAISLKREITYLVRYQHLYPYQVRKILEIITDPEFDTEEDITTIAISLICRYRLSDDEINLILENISNDYIIKSNKFSPEVISYLKENQKLSNKQKNKIKKLEVVK